MSYDLTFEIDPALYVRAATVPIDGVPPRWRVVLQNLAAVVLAPFSIYCFTLALFDRSDLAPMMTGSAIGGGFVLAIWWRRHRKLIRIHSKYNDTGGAQSLQIDAGGIKVARPKIKSEIEWGFIRDIRTIDGATLIELPTARLIVPDTALPDTKDSFVADLEAWRAA